MVAQEGLEPSRVSPADFKKSDALFPSIPSCRYHVARTTVIVGIFMTKHGGIP